MNYVSLTIVLVYDYFTRRVSLRSNKTKGKPTSLTKLLLVFARNRSNEIQRRVIPIRFSRQKLNFMPG